MSDLCLLLQNKKGIIPFIINDYIGIQNIVRLYETPVSLRYLGIKTLKSQTLSDYPKRKGDMGGFNTLS